ncbi:hypothetical protein GETHPA_16430 [Geothrix rubra]|uniref:MgtC/SapB transporter n=1 Tax=Geothrix rubra TaxID=2927977 RepID=A0ABQ5Q6S8_9BACT|nr:MgtC/SapB family protein [Geothrix rubra]GLH70110.1 hypothetical protein GETHPA_16430 [Geothrix rubra]
MLDQLLSAIPPEALNLGLVLFLSFLIGLEREELKRGGKRVFGGVRTFPLLGLVGYVVSLLSGGNLFGMLLGFLVVGAFMLVSYLHKLQQTTEAGITTELSGLLVYLVGALVYTGHLWFACTLVVVSLLLLELKEALEGLTQRIRPEEVAAFTKFLLLSAVILPMVPNRDLGPFRINPFKTWLVVVAVSGVSYASYVLLKAFKDRGGIFLSAILGGFYSSTVITVVLAKRAAAGQRPHEYTGGIVVASAAMYLKILALVWMFNRDLALTLAPWFLILAAISALGGWFVYRLHDPEATDTPEAAHPHNPLELRAAFFFAAVFVVMLIVTQLAITYLGRNGVYSVAGLMGLTDVTPFIMGMTHAAGVSTSLHLAACSIAVSAASNNLVKGFYAYGFAKGRTGLWSLGLLGGLTLLGLLPLIWL